MNKETIFNIFLICNSDIISLVGFRVHELEGSDDDKIKFLLSRVEQDSKEMAYIEISDNFKVILPNKEEIVGITLERFNTLLQNGTEGIFYEPIYQTFEAPETPLYVSTMIVDGEIKVTKQQKMEAVIKTKFTESITESITEHYLSKFLTEDGLNFAELINEDFMDSIKILYNKQKYVSCIKLLMSAIDTFAFIEFGDIRDNFKNWLSQYCDLTQVKITSEELWEYRNSILHMTNSQSRKVIQKSIFGLSFYVSKNEIDYMTTNGQDNYFSLPILIKTVNSGIAKWMESYNTNKDKFEFFCARYDLILSDSRYNRIHHPSSN